MLENPTFEVIRLHDRHLESLTRAQLRVYANTRDRADLPKTMPADAPAPVVFHCKTFSRDAYYDYVAKVDDDEARYVRSFITCVVKITGHPLRPDGFQPDFVTASKSKGLIGWTTEELDVLRLAPADLSDIGMVAYMRSAFPFDCSPRYRLLRTSEDGWAGNAHLYAAKIPEGAPPSSEKPKDE